jgi:hypothetical protein
LLGARVDHGHAAGCAEAIPFTQLGLTLMARHDAMQDTPRADATKPDGVDISRRRDAVRTAILGLNLWFAMLLWPLDELPPSHALVWGGAALAMLAVGVTLVAQTRASAASWLLLLAFPVLLALALVNRATDAYDPLSLALVGLSLLAYGAVAASVTAPGASALPYSGTVRTTFIDGRTFTERTRWILVCIAAVLIVVVAPTLGGRDTLEAAWGEAATEGALLTAVVAASIGGAVIASYTIGITRPPRRRTATDRRWRVAALLLAAAVGALTYAFVS